MRALGMRRRPRRAMEVLLQGGARRIDLARTGDRLFATVAALGLDAEVNDAARSGAGPLSGAAGYLWTAVARLRTFDPPVVRLTGELGEHTGPVLLLASALTRSCGGGLRVAPDADPADGRLDVCIVGPVPAATVLRMLPRLFWGPHVRHPAVHIEPSARVRLATSGPRIMHADGDYLTPAPARLDVLPGALSISLPVL